MSYTNFESNSSLAGNCGFLLFKRTNNFAAVGSGDILGQIQSQGFDGVQFQTASFINISATGAPAVNIPSKIQFYSSTGTATHLAMSIGQDGQVTLTDPFVNQTTLVVNNNQSTPNINLRTANATATNAPHMHFTRSHAGTGAVIANDDLGRLEFFGFQGGTAREAAEIKSVAQTVNGTNGVSSYLSFSTVPTSYAAMAERMRISADGNVTINTPLSGTALTVTGAAGSVAADFTGSNAGGISVNQTNGGAGSYQAVQSSVDVQPVYFNAFKNRAGGDINAGDILLQHNVYGYRGTNQIAGAMRCYAESVGATRVSAAFDWFTTSTAGALAQRLYLSSDGAVVINSPAAAGSALTVNGVNSAANYSLISQAAVAGGIHNAARLWNYDGTAGSATQVSIDVFNQLAATGGDPSLRFLNIGVRAVTLGIDTSTDQFVIANSSALGSGNILTWTASNNQINLPLQSCFFAILATDDVNVTGNGAVYTLGTNVAWTEIFDQNNNFNTNGTFTAPATGRYHFSGAIRFLDANGATSFQTRFNTSNRLIVGDQKTYAITGGFQSTSANVICDMDSGDTCTFQLQINGLAGDTADLSGDSPTAVTYFSGTLVA